MEKEYKKEAFSPFLVEKVTNSKKNVRVTQKARYVYLSQQKSEDCLTHLSYKLEESRPLYEALYPHPILQVHDLNIQEEFPAQEIRSSLFP